MEFMKDGVGEISGAISSLKQGKLGTGGDAHFYDDNQDPQLIKRSLDSSKESEKIKSLKWLLANLSKGNDVSDFFPDVVKNVVVKSVEVKKMVYNYLVHYADFNASCRENCLMSINSFQNDLGGTNQLIRGLALRVMTSIRVPDIIQIQLLAIRKCATDTSPYVRRCAATALPKIFSADPSQLDSLKQILRKLLSDSSIMVLGQAISSFNEICPTSYDTIHPCLRKICHLLADLDEWSQVSALNLLIRYTRNQFIDPAPEDSNESFKIVTLGGHGNKEKKRRVVVKKAFYSDDEDESGDELELEKGAEKGSVFSQPEADHNLDPDHKLILKSSTPLLKSRNTGVVVAVCSLHFYCGSRNAQSNIQIGKVTQNKIFIYIFF
jgi:AP-3 complex subunit beta